MLAFFKVFNSTHYFSTYMINTQPLCRKFRKVFDYELGHCLLVLINNNGYIEMVTQVYHFYKFTGFVACLSRKIVVLGFYLVTDTTS